MSDTEQALPTQWVKDSDLPRLCAIAIREIADRLERGQVLCRTAKAFVHSGATITIDDDPNHVTQYEVTVTVPVEALINGEATYGQ